MLNLEEFHDYVADHIKDFLPAELQDAEVKKHMVAKNNDQEYHAITIQPEGAIVAPTLYMETMFRDYQNGADLNQMMTKLGDTIAQGLADGKSLGHISTDFTDFENVKDNVIMCLVGREKNQKLLADCPHTNMEDLAIVYRVAVNANDEELSSILIHNAQMEAWGTSVEELQALAEKNTPRILQPTVVTMEEALSQAMGIPAEDIPPSAVPMYVISNRTKLSGAATILNDEVMQELAQRMGENFYVLPSSIHECLAVPESFGTPQELSMLVQEVNDTEVTPEERLSDHVYHYDAEKHTLSLADTSVEELQKVSEKNENYDTKPDQAEAQKPRRHTR
jgi:hypothetical protein